MVDGFVLHLFVFVVSVQFQFQNFDFLKMSSSSASATSSQKIPAVFLSHGGGPMPLMNDPGLLNFVVIRYEFECFSFLFIVMLFSAGNVKKNVFTVFIVPIVPIDGFLMNDPGH